MTLPQEASNLGEGLLVRPRAVGRAAGAREPGGSQLCVRGASCTRSAASQDRAASRLLRRCPALHLPNSSCEPVPRALKVVS